MVRVLAELTSDCPPSEHNLDKSVVRAVRDLGLNDDVGIRRSEFMESRCAFITCSLERQGCGARWSVAAREKKLLGGLGLINRYQPWQARITAPHTVQRCCVARDMPLIVSALERFHNCMLCERRESL